MRRVVALLLCLALGLTACKPEQVTPAPAPHNAPKIGTALLECHALPPAHSARRHNITVTYSYDNRQFHNTIRIAGQRKGMAFQQSVREYDGAWPLSITCDQNIPPGDEHAYLQCTITVLGTQVDYIHRTDDGNVSCRWAGGLPPVLAYTPLPEVKV